MATESVSFAGTDQNPFTAIPVGWTSYGTWRRWTSLNGINGQPHGKMLFNTYSGGLRKITAQMYYNSAASTSIWTLLFCNSSLTGFTMNVNNTEVTLVKRTADVSGSTIATLSLSNTADALFELEYNDTTGAITVKKNGSSILTGTYTDTPNLLAGIRSYQEGAGHSFRTVAIDYTPAQAVTSINGAAPFTASQVSSSAVTFGFTGLPSSITATWGAYSVPISNIGGTTNAPTFTKAVRVDGNVYPKNSELLTLTFINGSETASGTQTFNKDSDEVEVSVTAPIISDAKYLFGAIYTATGRAAVTGDYGYYKVPVGMSDLTIGADGRIQVTNAGTFQYWAYTAATAVNYYYNVTVSAGGDAVSVGGLTAAGLTNSGLTSAGLTSSGL